MKILTDIKYVKELQSNLRSVFEGPAGREVMAFLEAAVGYDQSVFDPSSPDLTLINDGKRQVVATIKTLLKLTPEQIVAMAKQKEE
jgi:excinuclease UvrABC nuclease subunit